MRFWAREIMGWALVALGLFMLYGTFLMLTQHYILEGAPLTFMGIMVFRGGIHLLKVAVAARVCLQAEVRLEPEQGPTSSLPGTAQRPGRGAGVSAR